MITTALRRYLQSNDHHIAGDLPGGWIRIAELCEVAVAEHDTGDALIEVVPVELVDISRCPPPIPRKLRWTPPVGSVAPLTAGTKLPLRPKP